MEKRMNKEVLIELINNLKVSNGEFWVLSTGALVLRDAYPDAGDLDLAVTDAGFEELKQNYNLKRKENGWYIVNDKIEAVCVGKKEELKYQPQKAGDYYVQNIYEYREYLRSTHREKDAGKLEIVEKIIEELEIGER